MSNPEDDPEIVARIAASLLGGGSVKNHERALSEARDLLKQSRLVIEQENDPKKLERENLCAKGRPQYEVRRIGNGVAMLVDYQFSEEIFIDELVKGLTQDKRPDRRKEFATKWWLQLRRLRPDAPDIADSRAWTFNTLTYWKETFDKIYQNERKETNAANLQPRQSKQNPVEIKKAKKDI